MLFRRNIINLKSKYTRIVLCLFVLFLPQTWSGANDWHIHDGSSSADIVGGDVFFEITDPAELHHTYRVRPAKNFGAPFDNKFRLRNVRLVPAIPFDACKTIQNKLDISGQVAFVQRGECPFFYKAMRAEEAGAHAVIITEKINNWEGLDDYIEMIHDDKEPFRDVEIPAGFMLGSSGANIIQTLDELEMEYAIINFPINLTFVPVKDMNQPPWVGW